MIRLYHNLAVALVLSAFSILIGCSGGISPTDPGLNSDGNPSLTDNYQSGDKSGIVDSGRNSDVSPNQTLDEKKKLREDRMYYGIWNIIIDPETLEAEAVPVRNLEAHYNVTAALLPPNCSNCVGIKVLGVNTTTFVYSLEVSLKNPTKALTGYDVRGTLLFPAGDNRELVNADDFTKIFDNSTPADRNPFKTFAKNEIGTAFPPQKTYYEQYDIKFPPPANLNVLYVVDASWPANQEEIYKIDTQNFVGSLTECNSGEGWLYVNIRDWQNNADGVSVDLTPLGGSVVEMTHVSGPTWKTYVNNYGWGTAAGTYRVWFAARSQNTAFELYDFIDLTVQPCTNTPPVWDTTVGVTEVNGITGGLEVKYGTASDSDTPVFFKVYYSEDSPIEWTTANFITDSGSPTNIPGLSDAKTYYVGVRAVDALGNEEKNTIQMTGVPSNPPVWQGTAGISTVLAGDHQVTVTYGTAVDPQTPVTYNIYWSETTPIDFLTANVMSDSASPTIVGGLDNFKTYYFAVRAEDALGSEDQNTKELSAIPNGVPEWVDTVGIQSTQPGDGKVTVTYGTAIDIDLPLHYNVYWSETSPINFATAFKQTDNNGSPHTINGLINGKTYFFAVRAADNLNNEEQNTVELPGTPNAAPTWENDLVGVQSLVPFDKQVTVHYGKAIDPDQPITYYIYYSTTSPINFDTAQYVTTQNESPYVVTNLTNFTPYFFAVRAEDSVGVRDTNTVEKVTIPNPAPVWATTVGVQSVTPGPGELTLTYGIANDIDVPVKYRAYYSKTSPINFGTASYVEDPGGSPTTLSGLDNGDTYFVAVRAVDSWGHEDQNTVTLSGIPEGLPEQKWSVFTGGVVQGSPALVDLNGDNVLDVVVGDQANKMVAYNGNNGAILWTFPTLGWADSSPACTIINGDSVPDVIFGSLGGRVYAVDGATGGQIWQATVPSAVVSSPTLANIMGDFHLDVIVGCLDGKVYTFNGANGSPGWNFTTGAGVFSSPGHADITGDSIPDIVVGSRDGKIYAINGSTGAQIWNFPTTEWVNSSPAIVELTGDSTKDVVCASLDGKVYAINGATGAQIWSFTAGGYIWSSPSIAQIGGNSVPDVIIGADTSSVYGINGANGAKLWEYASDDRIWSSAAMVDLNGDSVPDALIGSDDSYLYAINGANGGYLWRYPTGDWIDSSPAVADIDSDGFLNVAFGRYDGYVTMLHMPFSPTVASPWFMFRKDLIHSAAY